MKPSLTKTIRGVRSAGLTVTSVTVAPDGTVTIQTLGQVDDVADDLAKMRATRAARKAERDPRTVTQRVEAAKSVALAAWAPQPKREPAQPPASSGVPEDRLLIGIAEAARMMGVSKRTVWRKIGAGEISTRRLGVRRLIHRDELQRFLQTIPH